MLESVVTARGLDNFWLASCLESHTFCVKVGSGKDQKTFQVHEAILRNSSPYFSTLLNSSFIETQTKEVVLDGPVDSVRAFRKILEYMYSPQRTYIGNSDENIFVSRAITAFDHAEIFIMAHRLCMDHLERLALYYVSRDMASGPTAWDVGRICALVDLVYMNTADPGEVENPSLQPMPMPRPSDELRRILAQCCASRISSYKDDEEFKALMVDFPAFRDNLIAALMPGEKVKALPPVK